jgi:molybdenum cofactor cytidylyltransferase
VNGWPAPSVIVLASGRGERGHPVGFCPAFDEALANLSVNQGAARIITAQAAIELIVTNAGCVTDIDTLADLERVRDWMTRAKTR